MPFYLVTVKLPKNSNHDPHNKVTGLCPLSGSDGKVCTDVTGEHHTFMVSAKDIEDAKEVASKYKHITRIEEI